MKVTLYEGDAGAPLVIYPAVRGEGREIFEAVRAKAGRAAVSLAEISDFSWFDDLTPWEAEPPSKKFPPMPGGGPAFLKRLENEALPQALLRLSAPSAYAMIAGYSLAGLFAAWAVYETNAFARCASASGSYWYPGWTDYLKSHEPARGLAAAAVSVGERESASRNPVLARVGECARLTAERFKECGVKCDFTVRAGGHFGFEVTAAAQAVITAISL
jgi:predicted alpha/beta superfamily hydrolase